jgi:glutamate synthase (NADPH/NADH) small chain
MDCGIPFCHTGCPVNNIIPDWNDLVYRDHWKEAIRVLHSTNNFPEFTGRICPAPCEAACVLGINEPPVTIKVIEKNIVERAWAEGWIQPEPPETRTGKRVAVVGSGPSGMAAAQQLNRAGHLVTLFEKNDRLGGLMRYGIPDFKMEKHVLDRRLEQMAAEGVHLETKAHIGGNVPAEDLRKEFDAILLCGGAEAPRDLKVPGRELKGIHFAMEFLPQQNKRNAGDEVPSQILATGKRVVIIGGGDTGADCLGTCHRHKAKSVHQFEIMPMPPDARAPSTPWPLWPLQLRSESSHEEGGLRDWSIGTTHFSGDENGNVKQLHAIRVGPPPKFEPIPGTEFILEADLVLLALGFLGPVKKGMIEQFGVDLDARSNIATDANYMSSVPGIFAAGDMRRGQSLVVWAISEGRKAAAGVDRFLMGSTRLK